MAHILIQLPAGLAEVVEQLVSMTDSTGVMLIAEGEQLPATWLNDGWLMVDVDQPVELDAAEFRFMDQPVSFERRQAADEGFDTYVPEVRGADAADIVRLTDDLAKNAADPPTAPSSRTRLHPGRRIGVPIPPVAATPAMDQSLPANGVAERRLSNYLTATQPLTHEADGVPGLLYEIESTWESLGWAIGDWLSTESLGPDDDIVVSETAVRSDSNLRSDQQRQDDSAEAADSSGSASVAEGLTAAGSQRGRNLGIDAGVGRKGSAGIGLKPNPILNVQTAISGAVQIGFSMAAVNADTSSKAELQRRVENAVRQSNESSQFAAAQDQAAATGSMQETRSLRASRNTNVAATSNLGRFSIVRQWLVTTQQSRARPIIFFKVRDVDVPFTPAQLAADRTALAPVLLDASLAPVLSELGPVEPAEAETFRPPTVLVRGVQLTAKVVDAAEGRKSGIECVLQFAAGDLNGLVANVQGTQAGDVLTAAFNTANRPLTDLLSWRLTFKNPGITKDKHARLTNLSVELNFEVDGEVLTHKSVIAKQLDLFGNAPVTLMMNMDAMKPPELASLEKRAKDRSRLLEHVNSNVVQYRLAVDLQTDPETRFARMSKDTTVGSLPADFTPVGVAGVHLAFLSNDTEAVKLQGTEALVPTFRQFISAPQTGTFLEAVPGSQTKRLPPVTEVKDHPRVPTKDGAVTWPSVTLLTSLARGADLGGPGAAAAAVAAPEVGTSELLAKLSETLTALASTSEALAGLVVKTKEAGGAATPDAPPDAKPAEPKPGEDGDSDDGKPKEPTDAHAPAPGADQPTTPPTGDVDE